MKIRLKLLLSNLLVGLIVISISLFFIFQLFGTQKLVEREIPLAIKNLSSTSYLDSLAQFIRYYDEVLTQSARNYALTGDKKWKDRYYSVVNDLDTKIKDAIAMGGDAEKLFFDKVNDSNIALVALEERSFSLVESGDKKGAIDILDSQEYANQKAIYSAGLNEYLQKRGAEYQQALVVSTKAVESATTDIEKSLAGTIIIFAVGIGVGFIIILLFAWYFSRTFTKPLYQLKSATEEIVKGDLSKKVDVRSNDEFESLAESFNVMSGKLKENIESVEQKIKERTKELETLNKYMVGRELKMIELKKQINQLEKNQKS